MMTESLPALKDVFSYKSLVHAVAGAVGSTVAITVFYPLDTARTRLQLDEQRKAKFSPTVVREIFEEEGLTGLYKGWLPTVTSIWSSNFVYFYIFNTLKVVSYGKHSQPYAAKDLLLAYIAGVSNVLSTTPLWVASTRLKLQGIKWRTTEERSSKHPRYKGILDCMRYIYAKDGVRALWSGTATSMFLATNPAIHFMVYEALKRYLLASQDAKKLSGFSYFLMGAAAKMVATFLTYPLQVVQARLRSGKDKTLKGVAGMVKIMQELLMTKGLSGLYKGLEAKMTQTALMAALMFYTYEKIKAIVFKIMRAQMAAKAAV